MCTRQTEERMTDAHGVYILWTQVSPNALKCSEIEVLPQLSKRSVETAREEKRLFRGTNGIGL